MQAAWLAPGLLCWAGGGVGGGGAACVAADRPPCGAGEATLDRAGWPVARQAHRVVVMTAQVGPGCGWAGGGWG
jgi:hypothetical protein